VRQGFVLGYGGTPEPEGAVRRLKRLLEEK
jgi:hypothetical protein